MAEATTDLPSHELLHEATACTHHWLLGDPVGGVIPGRCKRCHAERPFPAHPEGTDRFDDYRELLQPVGAGPRERGARELAE